MKKVVKFDIGQRVVYPSHGVGEIVGVELQSIAGTDIQVYVVSFPQDKMMLKVPVNRSVASGLRALVSKNDICKIYSTLQGKPKQGNRMWSRRAQEYETKINSGDILSIAEVVRDLYKNVNSDRSYSERTIYESALSRLVKEISILENIDPAEATETIVKVLREKTAA